MSAQEIQKINKRLSFLSELPKEKDVKSFSFKGKNYKRDKIEFSTVAQVTDLLQMNQDEENVGAKILNAIAVIYYRDGESEYTAQRFKQMKDELLTLPFPVALNSSVFFSRGLRRFFPDVLRDSLKKLTIQQTENLIQGIENESESNDFGRFFNGTTSLSDLLQETS
jgi:hypothetical protein